MKDHHSLKLSRRHLLKGAAATTAAVLHGKPVIAQGKKEIVIGNIDAYSGPAAVYSAIGRTPGGYLEDDQPAGRHKRPHDQVHHL